MSLDECVSRPLKCLSAKTKMRARNFLHLRARENNARVCVESRRSQGRTRSRPCQRPGHDFPLCFGAALMHLWVSSDCGSVGNTSGLGAQAVHSLGMERKVRRMKSDGK